MTQALATQEDIAEQIERVLIAGDLSRLNQEQRVQYYRSVCESLDLNPLTRPLDYINLGGKLVLYANKNCGEQLRRNHQVSIYKLERDGGDETYDVTAYARNALGREDASLGSVSIKGLSGEALSNAKMKAETKAKRRVTLSLCGLGMLDETEVETVPGATRVPIDIEKAPEAVQTQKKAIVESIAAIQVPPPTITVPAIVEPPAMDATGKESKDGITWTFPQPLPIGDHQEAAQTAIERATAHVKMDPRPTRTQADNTIGNGIGPHAKFRAAMMLERDRLGPAAYFKVLGDFGFTGAEEVTKREDQLHIYNTLRETKSETK